MDVNTFLTSPEVKRIIEDSFTIVADSAGTFNVTETMTDGYYSHITIADMDEDGRSFAKTLKLSKIGAGVVMQAMTAVNLLAALYCLSNEEELINEFDSSVYLSALSETVERMIATSEKNVGV